MSVHMEMANPKLVGLHLLAIALFAALIYSNTFKAPFFFDDVMQIEDKAKIRDLDNYFSANVLRIKRPFGEMTFALNYKLGQLDTFGYHLVNLCIHIINGLLAYLLALTIFQRIAILHSGENADSVRESLQSETERSNLEGKQTKLRKFFQSTIDHRSSTIFAMSLFAGMIFVAHPIQTQAVTYIVQRYTSLAAMFYMGAVFLYIMGRLRQQGGRCQHAVSASIVPTYVYFAFSFVCGMLGFSSKESTVSLPLAIVLVEFFLFDRTWKGWRRKLMWMLPAFIALVIFVLYVSGVFRGGVDFGSLLEDVWDRSREAWHITRWEYLCTQFNVVVIYVRLLFFPFGQNVDYMYPFKSGFFDGWTPLAFLFVVGILSVGVWSFKRRPIISFGIFWFFITLSVESSIIPIRDALFEHRLYLPMFGFALVITPLVFGAGRVKRLWRFVIAGVLIVGLGSATYLRNEVYHDRLTLWSDVVSKSPHNYRAHFNLGNALRDEGRLNEAIDSYRNALAIKPNYAVAHDNLGVALLESGRLDEAIRHFSTALETRRYDAMIHSNLGTALMHKGKLDEAIYHFSRALRRRPSLVEARNNLGIVYARQGNLKEAAHQFSEALRTEPENAEIHKNLGFALMLQGDIDGSMIHFSEAIRIKPDYAEVHDLLGKTLTRRGDYDGAIAHFERALEIRPELESARQGLAKAVMLNRRKHFQ